MPEKNLKVMNMPILTDPASRAPENTTRIAGTVIAVLRPKRSATQLIHRAPKNAPAWNKPFMAPIRLVASGLVASSKYAMNDGCSVAYIR